MPQYDKDRDFQMVPKHLFEKPKTTVSELKPYQNQTRAKDFDEIKTPEELAGEIVNFPNLWGMYSIADKIWELIRNHTVKSVHGAIIKETD